MLPTRRPVALLLALLALLILLQACAGADPAPDAAAPVDGAGPTGSSDDDREADEQPAVPDRLAEPFGRASLVLAGDGQELELTAFVADTPDLRRQGLMGWEALPDDSGMLFVYDDDARGGFWMKDTLIALSIAFADADGRIHTILDMEPCEADPCPTYRPSEAYRSALEVERGYFEEHGVEPGWILRLEQGP